MHGGLLVVKPPGMTSHDVVDFVRKLWAVKAGHTGTLDPAAAGLLVLCLGAATRLSEYLVDCDKVYRAEITLGLATTTADAEGQLTAQQDAGRVTAEQVEEALAALTGPLEIAVPAHSAVSRNGTRLYKRARRGEAVELPTRQVAIHRWELIEFAEGKHPTALTEVQCSKGTYVRSLAELLGNRLGTSGYLSFLLRTQIGPHHLEDAWTLERLAALDGCDAAQAVLINPPKMLAHMPRVVVDQAAAERLRDGNAHETEHADGQAGLAAVVTRGGSLLCVAESRQVGNRWRLQPRKVFHWDA